MIMEAFLEHAKKDIKMASADKTRNKKGRPRISITACPHLEDRHYAKGMCIGCYNKIGRTNRAFKCPHKDRHVYARGMCQ